MAFFAVEKKKISKLWAHPNADRLDLAQVEGLVNQFVCQKDTQVEGNEVVYFPIDSVFPQALIDFCGIGNMMAGANKNRIKTVKLRGEISQGFVLNADRVKEYLKVDELPVSPLQLTESLGVTKYEPPVLFAGKGANLTPLTVYDYDIEGAERHPEIIEALAAEDEVWISEKLEGTNFGVSIDVAGVLRVNQHHNTVTPIEGAEEDHTFIAATKKMDLDTVIKRLQTDKFPGKSVTIRGELVGPSIQGNLYKFLDHKIFVFEIDINGKPLGVDEMGSAIFGEERIRRVPTIFRGKLNDWLHGKSVQEASNGQSLLGPGGSNDSKEHDKRWAPVLREGIVIKPIEEKVGIFKRTKMDGSIIEEKGRLFIKQRSPEYLAKEKD